MIFGDAFTHWTARAAFVLYVLATIARLRNQPNARGWWTVAFLLMLVHVAAAFQFVHHWRHQAAYDDTAKQTMALLGQKQGGGIFANYALLLTWGADVLWWWIRPAAYFSRARAVSYSIHGFLAFIWFNAAVIFAHGLFRWMGLVGFMIFAAIAWHQKRTASTVDRRKQFT